MNVLSGPHPNPVGSYFMRCPLQSMVPLSRKLEWHGPQGGADFSPPDVAKIVDM